MNKIYKNRLKIWAQVSAMILALIAISCADDVYVEQLPEVNETSVRINIYTPGTTIPYATRSQDAESAIESVRILVLEQENDRYKYAYMADGEQIISSSTYTTFTARLNTTQNPLKLILVANYKDAFSGNAITRGMYEEDIRSALTDSYPPVTKGKIPMYGEASLTKFVASETNNISVTMLRAVARIDVVNEIDGLFSAPFSLEEVYFFRANNRIQLIPDASVLSGSSSTPLAIAASVPANSQILTESLLFQKENADEQEIRMNYIPESLPLTEGGDSISSPTCLVVGGYYNGENTLSYYRVDFDSKHEGHPFGQILRNHKYVFNISQVNSSGYTDPEDAANGKPGTMVANVQIWEENTSNMYFSAYHYIGVSKKEAILEYYTGATDVIYVESDIAFNIQLANELGEGYGDAISIDDGMLSHQYFNIEVVKDNSDPNDIYRILITTNTNNMSLNDVYGTHIVVNSDFCSFPLLLLQNSFYGNQRIIKVLSTGSYGQLGGSVPASGTHTQGTALRKVLDNPVNFSPTGKIPVAGFDFYTIDNTGSGMGATSIEDVNVVKNFIDDMDILHLSFGTTPSNAIAQVVIDWLDASPNHILILGLDLDSANKRLRELLTTQGEPEWTFGTSGDFTTGTLTPANSPFMNGPFGEVAPDSVMGITDKIAGRTSEWNSNIIPLLFSLRYPGTMTMGINIERGIVYFGDCQFTAYDKDFKSMSEAAYTNGTVSSDFDRLMANIWTWVVGKVLEKER